MRKADAMCCTQKERLFVAKWMYTHINASAATRRRGAQPPAPWPLDEGALFRALQDDSKPVTSFNLAHTIVRYASLLLKRKAADGRIHSCMKMRAMHHHLCAHARVRAQ